MISFGLSFFEFDSAIFSGFDVFELRDDLYASVDFCFTSIFERFFDASGGAFCLETEDLEWREKEDDVDDDDEDIRRGDRLLLFC